MLPSLDPVQFSALLGVAVVRARVAAAVVFFSLQFGLALKVYFDGSLVEAGVEAVVGDGVAEVLGEVAVEAVVEEA